MVQLFRRDSETPAVHAELVALLFTLVAPMVIMAATFAVAGGYLSVALGGWLCWTMTVLGALAAVAKLALVFAWRRRATPAAEVWERWFAALSFVFSIALGVLAAATFFGADETAQLLATGMLFGYCSGVVARTSARPVMCFLSLSLAAVPVIVAAAIHGGTGYEMLAAIFAAILFGSFESVRHAYCAAIQQIVLREELATVARNDLLTGLPNRFGLREAYTALSRDRTAGTIAVHCLDLDRFKPVNDRYGHSAGDALLRQMAERIERALRTGDIAARLGGDEFVVVQRGAGHGDEAALFARRLVRVIAAPYEIKGQRIEVGVSIGTALAPPGGRPLDELLAAADVELYRAKAAPARVA